MIQRTYQNRWWVFFGFFSFGQLWSCFFCRHLGFWTPKFNDFPSNFLCNANGVCGAVTDTRDRDPRHSGARWMMAISMRKAWYSKVGIERRNFLSRTPPTGYNSKVQPSKFHISPLKNDGTGRRSGFLLGPGQFLGAYGKLPGSIDGIEKKSYTTYDTWDPLKIEFVHPFVEDPYVTPDAVLAYKRSGVQKWKIREWWLSKSLHHLRLLWAFQEVS